MRSDTMLTVLSKRSWPFAGIAFLVFLIVLYLCDTMDVSDRDYRLAVFSFFPVAYSIHPYVVIRITALLTSFFHGHLVWELRATESIVPPDGQIGLYILFLHAYGLAAVVLMGGVYAVGWAAFILRYFYERSQKQLYWKLW